MERVLVASDFSSGSTLALRCAARIVERTGAALTVVHVMETMPMGAELAALPLDRRAIEDELQQRVWEELRTCGLDPDATTLRLEVRIGRAMDEILQCAEDTSAELIIVGHRGRGLLERMLLGSVAAALVRHATMPVLIAREWTGKTPQKVLAAVDLSDAAPDILRTANRWAKASGAELHVLYAWEIAGLSDYHSVMPGMSSRSYDTELAEDFRTRMIATVDAVLGPNHGATVDVRAGTAAYEIVFAAERSGIDLVVMGSHGRKGLSKLLLGNTAERVIQEAVSSVLVLRMANATGA